jgi:hypothetical protein
MLDDNLQSTNMRAWRRPAVLRWMPASPLAQRTALVSATILASVVVLGLVAVSPLALQLLGSFRGTDWMRLSNIGQTYGAASALLTGLALIGVAGSILFQSQTVRVSRAQSSQEHLTRLLQMAMEDPIYQWCWGADGAMPTDVFRQHLYLNLIFSYWQRDYVLGGFGDDSLRGEMARLFVGEAGRRFWASNRGVRPGDADSYAAWRFCQIAEEEYQKAIASGPPGVPADGSATTDVALAPARQGLWPGRPTVNGAAALLLGAVGGTIIGRALSHRAR